MSNREPGAPALPVEHARALVEAAQRLFELKPWAEHPHPGPVVSSAEELRELVARKERERAELSERALKDEPPRKD